MEDETSPSMIGLPGRRPERDHRPAQAFGMLICIFVFDLLFFDYENTLHVGGPLVKRNPQKMVVRSEEHTSELQSLMRISYAVFCLKKKKTITKHRTDITTHNTAPIKKPK